MGLTPRVGSLTQDGVACPDVGVLGGTNAPPGSAGTRVVLELVGVHNRAADGGRLLGDAVIKYRLLQARGYIVVPVSCDEWDTMEPDSRCLYLQEKLDSRLVAAAAAAAAASRVAGSDGTDADDYASDSDGEERVGLWRRSAPKTVTSSSGRAGRPPPGFSSTLL
jgi:hypothetical protein